MIRILPEPVTFEWDTGNIDKNLRKHGVANPEAEEVFNNEPLIISEDVNHSENEVRFQVLGKTNKSRCLFASFVIRDNKIRVISIRDMNRKEEVIYEKV